MQKDKPDLIIAIQESKDFVNGNAWLVGELIGIGHAYQIHQS